MFGHRPDGKLVTKGVDPITRFTPYIMVERSDAQCYTTQYADSDILQEYVRKKRAEGIKISQMDVIIAAYVRMIAHMPELNRFVVGKKLYARNECCISFAMVKRMGTTDFLETTVKIHCDPATDTIFDVSRRIQATIERNRQLSTSNSTDKIANGVFKVPGLPTIGVGLLKFLDRIGCLPKSIIDASPFHTSMFITNMGSIGMTSLYHHIYNFGTTTEFIGLGKKEYRLKVKRDKETREKVIHAQPVYPMACVIDERVCAGAMYSMGFKYVDHYLSHPELLETPPDPSEVRYDIGCEYHLKEEIIH